MSKQRARFRFESLESRQMMAGDVAAFVQNGHLFLNEAAGQAGQANGVEISQLANGNIQVKGLSAPGGAASLINGQQSAEFFVTGGLYVNFGGGQDKIQFQAFGETIKFQEAHINVGVASAAGDADKDDVSLANLKTLGSLTVLTGASDDRISIMRTTIGDGSGADRLAVMTGAGADAFTLKTESSVLGDVDIQTYDSVGENHADVVSFTGVLRVDKSLAVRLGAGDDYFAVGNLADPMNQNDYMLVSRSASIDAGAGADQILIARLTVGAASLADAMNIRAGAGQDRVAIDNANFENVHIITYDSLAENDADVVTMQRVSAAGETSVETGGGDDDLFVTDPADPAVLYGIYTQSLYANTGAGADEVHIEGTNVNSDFGGTGNLTIYTGAGADKVLLDWTPLNIGGYTHRLKVSGNVVIQTFEMATENEVDNVRLMNGEIYGSVWAKLGDGNDIFDFMNTNVSGDLDLEAGAGHDVASISGYVKDHVMAKLGEGDDRLSVGKLLAYRLIAIGDAGVDRLTFSEQNYVENMDLFGWEYLNGRRYPFGPFPTGTMTSNA
jgi:hypothetical protein